MRGRILVTGGAGKLTSEGPADAATFVAEGLLRGLFSRARRSTPGASGNNVRHDRVVALSRRIPSWLKVPFELVLMIRAASIVFCLATWGMVKLYDRFIGPS